MIDYDEIELEQFNSVETKSLGYKIFNQDYNCMVSNRDLSMVDDHDQITYEDENKSIYTSSGICYIETSNVNTMMTDEIVMGRAGFDPASEHGQEYLDTLVLSSLTINKIVELRYLDAYIEFISVKDIEDIYETVSAYLKADIFDPIHQSGNNIPEEDVEKLESLAESLKSFINGDPEYAVFFGLIEATGDGFEVQENETYTREELGVSVESTVITDDGESMEVLSHVSPNISKYL